MNFRRKQCQRCRPTLFFYPKPYKEVKTQARAKHLPWSSLCDEVIMLCSSSRNSLDRPGTPQVQRKAPPLLKWHFDLIYLTIQIPKRMPGIISDHISMWSWSAGDKAGIFDCYHKSRGHTWNSSELALFYLWSLLPSCGELKNCSF